ncbi:MAG: 1-acyl-sn-glycerol-3-phosphate acyltransferase [Clostridia bacterium]|nr:1-acyl-sn-glycerol-3-phosphate acyltransferase [Clostridia bacterium]MBR2908544.1 1-acyl-sn-glycerol-3-phosphate acyltransferase [Clostridia bacterium]
MKKVPFGYKLVRTLFVLPVKFILNIRVRGRENIPKDTTAYMICSNHVCWIDPIIICAGFRQKIHIMAKKELFKIPVLAQLIRALGAYPIDRSGGNTGTIKATIRMLQDGDSVCVFPQGTRRRGQTIAETPLKPGAAMISLKAGVPIIPVRIKMKGDRYRPFRKNELIIGRPITVEELAYDPEASGEYARVTEIIRNRIAELE